MLLLHQQMTVGVDVVVFGHVTLNGRLARRRVRAGSALDGSGHQVARGVAMKVALDARSVQTLGAAVQPFAALVLNLVREVLDLLCKEVVCAVCELVCAVCEFVCAVWELVCAVCASWCARCV